LKCSHTFNLLDSRGAIGVTERANYFRRMRDLSRQVATAYVAQRQAMEYPWLKDSSQLSAVSSQPTASRQPPTTSIKEPTSFVFEIGSEELPASDVSSALAVA
jgi:glycyl-tRNA synthetase